MPCKLDDVDAEQKPLSTILQNAARSRKRAAVKPAPKFSPRKNTQCSLSSGSAPRPKFAPGFKARNTADSIGPSPALFIGKYTDSGLPWGLQTEDPVWALLLEDSGKPSLDYKFEAALGDYLSTNEEGYPKTIQTLADFGIHLCALTPTDRENVNQVPWQKGIYVNGNEAELKNAFLMYDRFFTIATAVKILPANHVKKSTFLTQPQFPWQMWCSLKRNMQVTKLHPQKLF